MPVVAGVGTVLGDTSGSEHLLHPDKALPLALPLSEASGSSATGSVVSHQPWDLVFSTLPMPFSSKTTSVLDLPASQKHNVICHCASVIPAVPFPLRKIVFSF